MGIVLLGLRKDALKPLQGKSLAEVAKLRKSEEPVDVLIDSPPGAWDDPGTAGHAALRAASPELTVISISWFGESGPYKDANHAGGLIETIIARAEVSFRALPKITSDR